MNGIVAYSRPRGKYGRYIFTVVLYFNHPTEKEDIQVTRPTSTAYTTYSCNYCGKWAEVTVTVPSSVTIDPTQQTKGGTLAYYRYDNVEPGDIIRITMKDSDLLFYQTTQVDIRLKSVVHMNYHAVYRSELAGYVQNELPKKLYDVFLINWDEHVHQSAGRSFRVEEDLISKTMNTEKITIKELALYPGEQPLALENGQRFIEGELKYLEGGK